MKTKKIFPSIRFLKINIRNLFISVGYEHYFSCIVGK